MKLRKTMVIIILGIVITAGAQANGRGDTKPSLSRYENVIEMFMDSYRNSDSKKLNAILSDEATFKLNRNNQIITQDRRSLLQHMKRNEGTIQTDCHLDYKIIAESDALVIACVDVDYALYDGLQHNYLIIENDGKGAWKITQVYKVFISKDKAGNRDTLARK